MTILYIGQYTEGTTSKMRADQIKEILSPCNFFVIDTNEPFFNTLKLFRSFGFRYKKGPLITNINQYISARLNTIKINSYDLIWIDKAIFLTPQTTQHLKSLSNKLIHFTPDMAFYGNQSRLYNLSAKYYDYHVTTKTAEVREYQKKNITKKLVVTTQGFDKAVHQPTTSFDKKENAVAFIGLCEPSRELVVQKLINQQIKVKLAGKGWKTFVEKNNKSAYLEFIGDAVFSQKYTQFISSCYFSIGLLSKKFPELHTTRTFEIPACGTALITERNKETTSFFTEEEAIFYDSIEEMIDKIKYYQAHPDKLELLTHKGTKRVNKDGRDYESILRKVLEEIGELEE